MRVFDGVAVEVYASRAAMGRAAAAAVAAEVRRLATGPIRMVFAAAPSQEEFLTALTTMQGLPWERVEAFHLDEYVGLPPGAPQGFGDWLAARLFDRVPLAAVRRLDGRAVDLAAECDRYGRLLRSAPPDMACVGIGENGHLAFNDPPADLEDRETVRLVDLEARCRRQQVHDGCFAELADVPRKALTMTVPAILAAAVVIGVVPAAAKAPAVRDALLGPVGPSCPASALRRHRHARLFLDAESAALL